MKKFTILLTAVFLIINLSACGNELSDKNFRKLMTENGYDSSFSDNVTVVDSIDLNDNVKGLTGNNKLVLIKNTSQNRYGLGAVDLNSRTITDCSFGYSPLNIIILKIFESNEDTNIKNLKKAAEYINKYGYDCFNDQDIAESYIRDITDANGIISTSVAQKAIEDSLSYIFPDISKAEDSAVIFEDGNANPMYYAALESTMVYRLSSIIPESHYKLLDRQTQNNISAIYGAPYTLTNVWAVVDKNMNKVGTFNSLDNAKAKLSTAKSTQQTKGFENSSSDNAKNTPKPETNGKYIMDSQYIDYQYLDGFSREEIRLMLNEIYARHGYIFKLEQYKRHFESQSWYKGTTASQQEAEKNFNKFEDKNKDTIAKYESEKGWR